MRGYGLGLWSSTPITQQLRSRSPEELADWLEMPLPELPSLTAAGYRRCCFSWAEDLPDRSAGLAAGDYQHLPVALCWVPASVDLDDVVLHRPAETGVTTLTIAVGFRADHHHDGAGPLTDFTATAGGHSTVSVRGRVVGVQRAGQEETRVAWSREESDGAALFTMHVPRRPVPALELLLRGRHLP